MIKLTFLFFFIRVFNSDKKMRYMVYFGIFSCTIFYIAMFFRSLFLCSPMEKAWDPFIAGDCLPIEITPYTTGIFNTLSDIYILALPMPLIWHLNMAVNRRLRLMAVFSLGIL